MGSVREKFIAALRSAQEMAKAVSVYVASESEGSKFEVGFVSAISEHDLTLACLNARGELDGSLVIRIEDIDVVELDDPYTRKVQLLHEYVGSVYKAAETFTPGESFEGQLKRAIDEHLVVTAEDDRGHRFTGFVCEHGEEFFVLELLNAYGAPDGRAIVQKACVIKLEVDRRDEQARAFLYRYHYELKRLLEP